MFQILPKSNFSRYDEDLSLGSIADALNFSRLIESTWAIIVRWWVLTYLLEKVPYFRVISKMASKSIMQIIASTWTKLGLSVVDGMLASSAFK